MSENNTDEAIASLEEAAAILFKWNSHHLPRNNVDKYNLLGKKKNPVSRIVETNHCGGKLRSYFRLL